MKPSSCSWSLFILWHVLCSCWLESVSLQFIPLLRLRTKKGRKNGCKLNTEDTEELLLVLLPDFHNRPDWWAFPFPSLRKEIRCTEKHRKIITAVFNLDSGRRHSSLRTSLFLKVGETWCEKEIESFWHFVTHFIGSYHVISQSLLLHLEAVCVYRGRYGPVNGIIPGLLWVIKSTVVVLVCCFGQVAASECVWPSGWVGAASFPPLGQARDQLQSQPEILFL